MLSLHDKWFFIVIITLLQVACAQLDNKPSSYTEAVDRNIEVLQRMEVNQRKIEKQVLHRLADGRIEPNAEMFSRLQLWEEMFTGLKEALLTDSPENNKLVAEKIAEQDGIHKTLLEFERDQRRVLDDIDKVIAEDRKKRAELKRERKRAKAKPSKRVRSKAERRARKKAMATGALGFSKKFNNLLSDSGQVAKSASSQAIVESVKRFPSIESPDEVKAGESVTVMVSLTEDQLTPTVKVVQGKTDEQGRLAMELPAIREDESWPIDVVLSASGFTFNGPNKATLNLPKRGDSTPVMFNLIAKASPTISSQRRLYATFWHKGKYLARVVKPIVVLQDGKPVASACQASAELSTESRNILRQSEAVKLATGHRTADLTIYMRRDWDSCAPTDYFITLSSPHLETRSERVRLDPDMRQWLLPRYQHFSRSGRGINIKNRPATNSGSQEDQLIGFGKLLYEKFSPSTFKQVYQELKNKLGNRFESILVYTDDPSIPWELMVPESNNTFLGIEHSVGRWIIPARASDFSSPVQNLAINGIRLVVPEYTGSQALASTYQEAITISQLPWKKKPELVKGDYASVKKSLSRNDAVILHYAGHGYTERESKGNIVDYGLILEDDKFRTLNWRAILNDKSNSSFVFFNACDVGQSEKAAGFVDGWSTTLTDTGSTGFISGLWELGDKGAALFSKKFYESLNSQFKIYGKASVAFAMRSARQSFADSGNPTYLAYVFYGDPELMLVQSDSAESSGPFTPKVVRRKAFTPEPTSTRTESKSTDDEAAQIVFDRYKASLYRIYHRELRRNPELKGSMLLNITVAPDGSVLNVSVEKTDIQSETLTQKIIKRVKRFRFYQSAESTPRVYKYKLDLVPAS